MPAILVTLVLALFIEGCSISQLLVWAQVLFETTMSWLIITAGVYGLAFTSWRRRIGRGECLVSGAVGGALFPFAVIAFRHFGPLAILDLLAIPPHTNALPVGPLDWTDATDYFAVAICLAFGVLGGWIFWGIGVRPAPFQPADAAISE